LEPVSTYSDENQNEFHKIMNSKKMIKIKNGSERSKTTFSLYLTNKTTPNLTVTLFKAYWFIFALKLDPTKNSDLIL